jgi:hypothetical protein
MKDNFPAIVIGIVVIGLIFILVFLPHTDRETLEVKIEKSERVTTGSGDSTSSKYLVFTDKGVFKNTDSLIEGKWNSSDVYGQIREGECYRLETYGWRVQFLSWYPNIVSAQPTECK